jgi:hypothetical protein
MANPFAIEPANPLQALMMGQQGYNQGRKYVQEGALTRAGQLYAAGDIKGAQAAAAQGGSLQALMGFAGLQNSDRDFAFRQEEAKRSQGNTDISQDLQERQINASAGQSAAQLALQRQQFEFMRQQGMRPEKVDIGGVPMLLDRNTNKLMPIGGMPAAPSDIPSGLDPATVRKERAQTFVKNEAADRELQEGGKGVLAMVDQLEKKILDPTDPKVGKKFGAAAGPFVAPASDAYAYDPRKLAYEGLQSRESKAYLDQIKQDAQAINSTLQRAILKGGGSITNDERAQVNQILGAVMNARSPEDAKALLDNFRGIARKMFKLPDAQAAAPSGPAQPGAIPPPPSGFVIQ